MFKVDMHVHTSQSSVCGKVRAEIIVDEYKKKGYYGIVITDHFNKNAFDQIEGENWREKVEVFLKGYRAALSEGEKNGLRVYLGAEIKTTENYNEYLIHGIDENFLFENENLFLRPISEIKKIAEENGYLIFQAHPCRDACIFAGADNVHGVEIFNGHFNHNSRNNRAKEICTKNNGIAISGSDAHTCCDIGNGGLCFFEEPENIVSAIKSGNYSIIETEPQHATLLFAHKKHNISYVKKLLTEKGGDAAVIFGDGYEIIDKNGNSIKGENGITTVKRCHIAEGVENIDKNPKSEQRILLTEEVNEKIKEKLFEKGIIMVFSEKGDDVAPYREDMVCYIAGDMAALNEEIFEVTLQGPALNIEKI